MPLALAALLAVAAPAWGAQGQMTWAVHVSLAPTWRDPAPGLITPFMVLYAVHDGLVKPMPGKAMARSLAQSWTASRDGLTDSGVGPRVAESGLGLIGYYLYSAPHEDVKLNAP